jgi:hypothetical protein
VATDEVVPIAFLACMVGVACGGCSTSLGPTGAYTGLTNGTPSMGIEAASLFDIGIFDTQAHVVGGIQTRVLERLHPSGDRFGQWRMTALGGITHMPRRHEMMLGCEAVVGLGLARYLDEDEVHIGPTFGALLGAPVRLTPPAPTWRADDIVGTNWFLVPSLGAGILGFDVFEATASLTLRVQLWSAITP